MALYETGGVWHADTFLMADRKWETNRYLRCAVFCFRLFYFYFYVHLDNKNIHS